MQLSKKSLVLGGSGALGKAMVSIFKNKGWGVMSLDLFKNEAADSNVLLDPNQKINTQLDKIYTHLHSYSKR